MTSVISKDSKTAIVLFNLGGPDRRSAVRPFLFNLFNDPAIIQLPNPFRFLLASLISYRRTSVAQEIYDYIGGKSPILEQTIDQQNALQTVLEKQGDVKVFTCMRYWHPMSDEVVKQVKEYNPDQVILLPLYPQYSMTTTGSSFKNWYEVSKELELDVPTVEINNYPQMAGFVSAIAHGIREHYFYASGHGTPRILFSAHGLPEKVINAGDPYQNQVEETVSAIVDVLGIDRLDYQTCYQSRVGPLKWIGPSTEDEIIRAGKDGVPVVVVPVSFVSEHSETLVELDIEYREVAEAHDVKIYRRVPTVQANDGFISGLADLCLDVSDQKKSVEFIEKLADSETEAA